MSSSIGGNTIAVNLILHPYLSLLFDFYSYRIAATRTGNPPNTHQSLGELIGVEPNLAVDSHQLFIWYSVPRIDGAA